MERHVNFIHLITYLFICSFRCCCFFKRKKSKSSSRRKKWQLWTKYYLNVNRLVYIVQHGDITNRSCRFFVIKERYVTYGRRYITTWLETARCRSLYSRQYVVGVYIGDSTLSEFILETARCRSLYWRQHVVGVYIGDSTLSEFILETARCRSLLLMIQF